MGKSKRHNEDYEDSEYLDKFYREENRKMSRREKAKKVEQNLPENPKWVDYGD